MISLETRIAKSPDLAVQDHFEETFVLNLSDMTVHCLGDIESGIWSFIDGGRTAGSILDWVCEEYDVERERAERDILEFLSDLSEKGLVSVA